MSFEAQFDDKEITKFLSKISNNTKEAQSGAAKLGSLFSAVVYADVIDHFQKEEGSKGPWKAWSNFYREHLEKIGRADNQKLQFSGRLRNNFKPQSYRKESAGLLWFNSAKTKKGFPYAKAHDDGGDKLPKRDFMWLSDSAMEKLTNVTLGFILDEGL